MSSVPVSITQLSMACWVSIMSTSATACSVFRLAPALSATPRSSRMSARSVHSVLTGLLAEGLVSAVFMDFTGGVAAAGLATGIGLAGALVWMGFLTAGFAFALAGAAGAALAFPVVALPAGAGLTGAGLAVDLAFPVAALAGAGLDFVVATLAGAGLAFAGAALVGADLVFAGATGFAVVALPAGAALGLAAAALTGAALAGVGLAFTGTAAVDFFAGVLVAATAFTAGLALATGFLALFVAGLLACFLAAVATIEPSV